MTAVLVGQVRNERRFPAWDEAVSIVKRTQAREQSVDDPQALSAPAQIMSQDAAGVSTRVCHKTAIKRSGRLDT